MKTLIIEVVCPFCGHHSFVEVPEDGYVAWRDGTSLIQYALPEVSLVNRETLISGLCENCQKRLF